jgi:type IV pilus assembly protein PilV
MVSSMTRWEINNGARARWKGSVKGGHPSALSPRSGETRRRFPARGHCRSGARYHGFGLLEALIAAVVLAIGLLGLASLYAVSLKSAGSAQLRTQATLLAEDILERMRANRTRAIDGDYDIDDLEDIPDGDCAGGDDVVACDLKSWRNLMTASKGFDSPIGSSIDCGTDLCSVAVSFCDRRGEIGAEPAADGEDACVPLDLVYRTRL